MDTIGIGAKNDEGAAEGFAIVDADLEGGFAAEFRESSGKREIGRRAGGEDDGDDFFALARWHGRTAGYHLRDLVRAEG